MQKLVLACLLMAATVASADESALPKLGPDAVSITAEHTYLRSAAAPDYWAFSPFVRPQFTTSACSVAAVLAAVNGLRGLPERAEDMIMDQPTLLALVDSEDWTRLSEEGGDGVTFEQLEQFTAASLDAVGLYRARQESFRPADTAESTLADLRTILAGNEVSADDVLLVYFNQGVVTGDWDGPHVALIGAYDAASDRVLVLEVDQEWYVPYWTPAPVLLAAMVQPTSAEHGPLEGGTGGLLRVWR